MNHYTVTYTRNGGKWRYENIDAEDEKEAREEFARRLDKTLNPDINSTIFMGKGYEGVRLTPDKEQIEKEIAKFEIVTVSKFI